MPALLKNVTGLGLGLLSFLVLKDRPRKMRRRAMRRAMMRDYERSAQDADFMAEMDAIDSEFSPVTADGLETEPPY